MPGTREVGSIAFVAAIAVMGIAVGASAPAVTGDPTTDVVVRVCLVVGVAAGALLLVGPGTRADSLPARAWMVAVLVGAFLLAGAALVLSGSEFPPLGVALDQGFRSAAITKYAHTAALVDFAYKDLPAYYPPLFFWILGRASRWLDVAPYEALKLGLLTTALVVPLAALGLWTRVTRDRALALAVAIGCLAFQDWYEPYAWLAAVVFVPWWLGFVLQLGERRRSSTAELVVGSLIGGAILCTYYYAFFIGAVQLVLLLLFRAAARRRDIVLPPPDWRRVGIVLGGSAAVSAVYWLPLFASVVTTPGARPTQNRYFEPASVDVPLRFLEFDLVGWLMLFGLVYLACTALRSAVSMGLASLVGAAYGWILLGYVGVLVDTPLLTTKAVAVIDVALLAGAAIGIVQLSRSALRSAVLREHVGSGGLRAGLVAGAIAVVFALGQRAIAEIPYVEEQRAATAPSALLRTFESATRGRYADTVVLTDREQLPAHLPVYVFNAWNAHFSHPAAQFDRRTRFLQRLAAEDDPVVFAAALAHNRYDDVGSVALAPKGSALVYTFIDDAFPRGVTTSTIRFRLDQFAPAYFASRGDDTLAVFVPRSGDPLQDLDAAGRRRLRVRFAGDLDVDTR